MVLPGLMASRKKDSYISKDMDDIEYLVVILAIKQ